MRFVSTIDTFARMKSTTTSSQRTLPFLGGQRDVDTPLWEHSIRYFSVNLSFPDDFVACRARKVCHHPPLPQDNTSRLGGMSYSICVDTLIHRDFRKLLGGFGKDFRRTAQSQCVFLQGICVSKYTRSRNIRQKV